MMVLLAQQLASGPLKGYTVDVYIGGARVVCFNPTVWTGPKVITCGPAVVVRAAAAPGGGISAEGRALARFPIYEPYDASAIYDVFNRIEAATTRKRGR